MTHGRHYMFALACCVFGCNETSEASTSPAHVARQGSTDAGSVVDESASEDIAHQVSIDGRPETETQDAETVDARLMTAHDARQPSGRRGPTHHFVAIHCDPGAGSDPAQQYENLRQMVQVADDLAMTLTIMLTPPWVAYIQSDSGREQEIERWVQSGHELAGHHHSIYHPGTWDGYSDFSEQ